MIRKVLILFFLLSFVKTPSVFAQNNSNNTYEKQWQSIDSFAKINWNDTVIKITQGILDSAKVYKNTADIIKAQFVLLTRYHRGANIYTSIKKAEQYIESAAGVEKALWQSIVAEMYWKIYENDRYHILRRTALEETKSSDISTWDAPAFFDKIATLYRVSLENKEALQQITTEKYAPLIIKGINTRKLRPTIYDLLVFRALKFFQDGEKDVTKAAYHFELGGMSWFETAEKFIKIKVDEKDTNSLHFKALQLYQEIIAFHLEDIQPDALIDADLNRLAFVYQNSVSPSKDSLYKNALKKLELRYADYPAVAQVSYLIAKMQLGEEQISNYRNKQTFEIKEKTDRNIPKIAENLETIIKKFPKSEGAVYAERLLNTLRIKSLDIKTEAVNIPNENILTLVNYQNIGMVNLKIYRISNDVNADLEKYYDYDLEDIKKLTPLKTWKQKLPQYEDMEEHSTEIKIDALPKGNYLLVASLNDNLDSLNNLFSVSGFQVSNLE